MDESNDLALRAFYYDFCVVSTNPNLSRGYLSGLERMVNHLGPKSDLAKVCQAIACASHGKPKRRPQFVNRAEASYHHLLGSLAKKLVGANSENIAETRLIAMLLGLYQVIMANAQDPGVHEIHARGMATLLKVENSPLSLLGTHSNSQNASTAKTRQDLGIFSAPSLRNASSSLDDLLRSLDIFWTRSQWSIDQQAPRVLQDECSELNRRFAQWQDDRSPEFCPTAIGKVNEDPTGLDPTASQRTAGYRPGNIDTFFDLCVAGVWNVFRTARLLSLTIAITRLEKHRDSLQYIKVANGIVEDIFASVPYHLADNLPIFVQGTGRGLPIDPGRTLGGLLLLHPLYTVSKMMFLSDSTRDYAKACLRWISDEMGIGQAGVMADSDLDRGYLESGCMIIWSGFLG